MIATLLVNPMELTTANELWMLAPLCAAVAIVYKTVRTENLRRLPLQILGLVAYMAAGFTVLGAILWGIHTYWR